jgi:hypothetical protein
VTFGIASLVVAFVLGFVTAAAGFVYLNRKRPADVDRAEERIRSL